MTDEPTSGSSFAVLYQSLRSRDLPEDPTWHSRADGDPVPDWTDVLIDFRVSNERDPLTDVDLPPLLITWPAAEDSPGWALEGWAWQLKPDEPQTEATKSVKYDALTLIRFTDPDGFRFAIAVSTLR